MVGSFSSRGMPMVLWSCVARNDTIMVEAGEDTFDGSVSATAKELLKRDPTPGWEFHTHSRRSSFVAADDVDNNSSSNNSNNSNNNNNNKIKWPSFRKTGTRHKGAKFHVYEKDVNGEYIVWVFACVYDPNNIQKEVVQSFLTKLVTDTENCRKTEFEWLYGPTLACQESFGPILRHYMMQVPHLSKYIAIEQQVETAKERMSRNIELLLEREEKIDDLSDEATKLREMAAVFKRNAKNVQRMKMWQDAKHGMVMGTAITAAVAIITVPPLIALL